MSIVSVNSFMAAQRSFPNVWIWFPSGCHRVSVGWHHRVDNVALTLPLNSVDVDILKPDTGALQIERPLQTSSRGTSSSERQTSGSSGALTPEHPAHTYTEPVSEGEEDEDMDLAPGRFIAWYLLAAYVYPHYSQGRGRSYGAYRV